MKEAHFDRRIFELEKSSLKNLESWQMSDCHFCYKLLEYGQAKIIKLKDGREQYACWKCRIMHWARLLL